MPPVGQGNLNYLLAAVADLLAYRCHIFQMNGHSYCFKELPKQQGWTRLKATG